MAILFTRVTYKNFKSVGNSPVVIDLDRAKTTLITGKNGTGKSTMTSAICFALFGQDFTLNKPGLINSINGKHCEVTIEFEVGAKSYKVTRGIKPNIFKIWENGKLLNEESSTRDYQKILETQILKMDIRAFKQVVVVGGRSYTPFMKLNPRERREFIEDLLDIRIFSTMGVILKEKLKSHKEDMRVIDEELKTITEKVKLQKAFIEKLTKEKSVSLSKMEDAITNLESLNETLSTELIKLQLAEKEMLADITKYDSVSSDIAVLKQDIRSLEAKKKGYLEKSKFYSTTEECPMCTQKISHEHREHMVDENASSIDSCDAEIRDNLTKLQALVKLAEEQATYQGMIRTLQASIFEKNNAIHTNIQLIKNAHTQIEDLKKDNNSIDTEKAKLAEFAKKYIAQDKEKKELLESLQYYEFVQQVLQDGGIKTKIIKQYIPTINRLVNKYLTAMDFFVSFNLDENFDETIKSRHRDTFKYDNFSDGQAARIDLALMFAWRDIAKMRNAVNCNILMLDEADAAVDGDGSSLISELLQTVEKSNVFVISHKGDLLRDKFERVVEFETRNNFTVVANNS